MPQTVTLADLRDDAKEYADKQDSKFVTVARWNRWLNQGAQKLNDLLVKANGEDYYTSPVAFSITSGNTWTLPDTFYKLRGVDIFYDGEPVPIRKFQFEERGQFIRRGAYFPNGHLPRFRLIGNTLTILPAEAAVGSYQAWVISILTKMTADTDTIDDFNGWAEYVSLDAAIKCMIKEESDPSALMALQKDALLRATVMSATRDEGTPDRIVRTNSRTYYEDL